MNELEILKIRQDTENSQKNVNVAWQKFDNAQREHKKEVVYIFEKMSLLSAGIISLSITFLGYLISQDKSIFLEVFLKIPIYIFLYISWIFLILNLIIGLFVRWADSLYLFFNSQRNYHERRKDLIEDEIKLFENYSNLVFSAGDTRENQIEICNKNIKTLDNHLIKNTKNKEELYFKIVKFFQKFSVITFILGIFILIIFAIKITSLLILL